MKALQSANDAPFSKHDNLQDYLNDSHVNHSLHTFILSIEQRYGVSFPVLELFNKAYNLCRNCSANDVIGI